MIDSRLIETYVVGRDPAAFRDLVVRHGPAVLRTCRRMLHDSHEAEDAFQATFLILIRKAPSIRDPELLGPWLVGVARRVAARSRRRSTRQAERERRWAEARTPAEERDGGLFEVRRVVRDELDQLPDTYARPLALCYLEGLTHDEAARRLGCPVGTVKVRLVRARRLLRDRLDRRGVGLGVAFLLYFLGEDRAGAASSGLLAEATAESMTLAHAGDFATLARWAPRAVELSRVVQGSAAMIRAGAVPLLLAALVILMIGGVAAAARQSKTARAEAAAASARLAKVLGVDCK